jgi:hypothetical protein
MFFLGHMVWGYIFGRISASALKIRVNIPLLLFVAILPDLDIYLSELGITHRTVTHSLLFWLPISIVLLVVFRLSVVPYIVSIIQHIVFGDFIVNVTPWFWPWKSMFGLGFDLFSMVNITIETLGLILFVTYSYTNGDLRLILSKEKGTLISLLPILSLMLLPFLYIVTQEFVFSSELLIVGFLHLFLTLLFIPSLFNGLKRSIK